MTDIDEMTGREFEEYFAEILRRLGYRAQIIGGPGDGGADILATSPRGTLWAVQCKRQAQAKVGVGAVRQLLGAVHHEHHGRGAWLATTSFLTKPAMQLAIDNGVRVSDRAALLELIDEIEGSGGGDSPNDFRCSPKYRIRGFIKSAVALAALGGCAAFFLRPSPSSLHLPGRGCLAGYVCMYTAEEFTSSSPEHKYYSYGCYNLHNELGVRYILNSQASGAEVITYKQYDCSDPSTRIPRLSYWHGDIDPIESILITPNKA